MRHKAFDSSCSCMTSRDGCILDLIDEVGREFTDVMFAVTNQLQQLGLTDNETILLKAYVIFDGNIIFTLGYIIGHTSYHLQVHCKQP